MCKDPISKQGYILRFLVDMAFFEVGGHYLTHYNKFRSPVMFRLSKYQLLEELQRRF